MTKNYDLLVVGEAFGRLGRGREAPTFANTGKSSDFSKRVSCMGGGEVNFGSSIRASVIILLS